MAADKKTAAKPAATPAKKAAVQGPTKAPAKAAAAKQAVKGEEKRPKAAVAPPAKAPAKAFAGKAEAPKILPPKPAKPAASARPPVVAARPAAQVAPKAASPKTAAKKPESKKPESKKPESKKPELKKERTPPPPPSPFTVGDKVVYPHHGAAVITRKERALFQGQRTDYFVLEVATDQLILKVPVHTALDRGVRPVISRVVARKVLATFREPPEEAGANWSRWYKLLTEKINSGDIFQVAEVVRDLTFAQQTKGISPALKRMLSKARLILASELRFALDVTEEEAMRRLDKALPRLEAAEEL
jgi:CarD family transcriptional regulator